MIDIKKSMNVLKSNSSKIIKRLETHSKLSVTDKVIILPLKLIKRDVEPFVSLNPVDESQRSRLEESIRKCGFQKSNPVIVWKKKIGRKYDYILIEGFSRCAVCEKIGILELPCILREFKNEDEAVAAARYQEYSRRHDDAKSLFAQFEKLNLAELQKEPGRLSEVVARQLGISPHNAHKLLNIKSKATEEVKTALREGKISTEKAYKSVSNEKNYSPKAKAFMEGVEFCLAQINENMTPDEVRKKATESILKMQEAK